MLSIRNGAISAAVAAAVALGSLTPANASSRGDALAIAAVAGLFGTIATIAAADAARDRYYDEGPVYAPGYAAPVYSAPAYRHGFGGWRHHRGHR